MCLISNFGSPRLKFGLPKSTALAPTLNGLFPSILKLAKVIPIFKSGEKQSVNNYRSISLLSPFSKVIEKIIKVRLLSFIARNNILFQRESGFRKKFTTMFPIIDSVCECFDNINDKKYSCAITLDIRKAFGSVNHAILLNKLEQYGTRGVCHKLFCSCLKNRKQYVCSDLVTTMCDDLYDSVQMLANSVTVKRKVMLTTLQCTIIKWQH